jgi:hypothetical protein
MVSARLVGPNGYVCATDGDAATVALAGENLARLPEASCTAAARFWWGEVPEDIEEMRGRNWDYVVASDVAYEPAVFAPLCEALVAVSEQARTQVLLCNCVRSSSREKKLRCVQASFFLSVFLPVCMWCSYRLSVSAHVGRGRGCVGARERRGGRGGGESVREIERRCAA